MRGLFSNHPVLPVIVIHQQEHALPLAEALLAGGIKVIEITFRTAAAAGSIRAIREAFPEMLVGAGTVVTSEQAVHALDSGVQFGLAPGVDAGIVAAFEEAGIPFVPGVATPTDISAALKLGCTYQKFFPAGTLGGPAALKAVAAPFASMGVKFCPTGGVNTGNLKDYLALPAVFAVGGTWLAKPEEMAAGNWGAIQAKALEALALAEAVA